MNEEEKKTFKFLKNIYEVNYKSCTLGNIDIKNIVNIIEKQQKEIERLKEFEKYYENEKVVWQRKDYVSKDKIKELKEFYIKDYLNRNITLIPLNNLVKNINILLGE